MDPDCRVLSADSTPPLVLGFGGLIAKAIGVDLSPFLKQYVRRSAESR